jgi:hypothetical protein
MLRTAVPLRREPPTRQVHAARRSRSRLFLRSRNCSPGREMLTGGVSSVGHASPARAPCLPGRDTGQTMSSDHVVRKPLRLRDRPSRPLDQRLAVRFPRLVNGYIRLLFRLPPSSRFRQAVVWRGSQLVTEAFNRRDLDAAVTGTSRDFEFRPPHSWVDGGFAEPVYRGRAGFREFVSTWSDVWGPDLRMEAVELIDLGDRLVLLGELPTTGVASGLLFTGRFATVSELKDGITVRVQMYLNQAEALEAVGLRE